MVTKRRGCDCRHINVLALGTIGELFQDVQVDFGLVLAVEVQIILGESQSSSHIDDGLELGFLDDLNVAGYWLLEFYEHCLPPSVCYFGQQCLEDHFVNEDCEGNHAAQSTTAGSDCQRQLADWFYRSTAPPRHRRSALRAALMAG
jgi:hypothetical protein